MSKNIPIPAKAINIAQLSKIRLQVPPGALPPEIRVVMTIMPDGSTSFGYILAHQTPALKPLSDITRLAGVANMVGSSESTTNRSRQGDIVKVVTSRISEAPPNMSGAAPKQIADTIALFEALETNWTQFHRNVSKEAYSADTRKYLERGFEKTASTLLEMAEHYAFKGGEKKQIKEFCYKECLPYWLFTHLCTRGWIPDAPQENLTQLLFPKTVNGGFSLKAYEWANSEIMGDIPESLKKNSVLQAEFIQRHPIISEWEEGNAAQRKLFDAWENTSIPLMPPYSLGDNLSAGRKAKPVVGRADELALLTMPLGQMFQAAVGLRPRQYTNQTYWSAIADELPDPRLDESSTKQIAAKLNGKQSPLDALFQQKEISGLLSHLVFGLPDTELAFLKGTNSEEKADDRPPPPIYKGTFDKAHKVFVVNKIIDEKGDPQLDLTEKEKAIINNEAYRLPEIKRKERRFPIGDAPTQAADQLLAAIRPNATDRSKDKLFSGLYGTLLELFSSFNDPAVCNRAVAITRASMVRMKGEGLFFSSEALTGSGGELFNAGEGIDLFENI